MTTDNETPTKFCINCKHLLGKRGMLEGAENGSWKCYHPINIKRTDINLVTGVTVTHYHVSNIHLMRGVEVACGQLGRLFEEYAAPKYAPSYDTYTGEVPITRIHASRIKQSAVDLGDI